jgi:excinuclease ABC subunit C
MVQHFNAPSLPGVYLMKNARGETIYIGKARDLRKRVSSYFRDNADLPDKTARQVAETETVEFIVTDNEVEALVLEANLIRKNRPKYNIDLKESFRYAYVLVTDEEFPRLLTVRKLSGKEKGKVLGPFVSGEQRTVALSVLRKAFRIRTCKRLPRRECLLYHIGQCSAPCTGRISKQEYRANVDAAVRSLEGDSEALVGELSKRMAGASKNQRFEEALKLREQIRALGGIGQEQKMETRLAYDQDYVGFAADRQKACAQVFNLARGTIKQRQTFRFDAASDLVAQFLREYYSYASIPEEIVVADEPEDASALEEFLSRKAGKKVRITVPKKGSKKELLDLVEKNAAIALNAAAPPALAELKSALRLPLLPRVMECFDISNLGREDTVASMVRFKDGAPDKDSYRQFRIRTVLGQNDFDAIKEAVGRRYRRLLEENQQLPDLVVIDGGKGQLSAAIEALLELGERDVPVIALAKKNEEVYLPTRSMPVVLDRKGAGLKLLQAIRDEAHRFAKRYHTRLRENEFVVKK